MGTAQGKLLFENKKNSIKSLESDIQLLLLATRDSGKSTFFNQINFLQNPEEYKSEKIQTYKKEIYTNILNTMAKLCHHSIENGKFSKEENIKNAEKIIEIENSISQINVTHLYTFEIHSIVLSLWSESCIKEALLNHKDKYNIFDGAEYFFEKISDLDPLSYIVTFDDILRLRKRFIYPEEIIYFWKGNIIKIIDIGDAKKESHNNFVGTNGIIYVVSLSDYDKKCEDDQTNRMLDALNHYEKIMNNDIFKDLPFILLFNKDDLFRNKIQIKDLKCAFSDYDGGCNYEKAIEFIQDKFKSISKDKPNRVSVFTISALSTNLIKSVFLKGLIESGLIIDDIDHLDKLGESKMNESLLINPLKAITKSKKNQAKYKIKKKIGQGAFGTVYTIEDYDSLVMKKIQLASSEDFNTSLQEFQLTLKLDHENVVKFHEYYLEIKESEPIANIIMEYCPEKDLKTYLIHNELDLITKLEFSLQIIQGIEYLHQNNLIHRDLKPENIFLKKKDNGDLVLKIGDFGMVKSNDKTKKSIGGTIEYMSCEMRRGTNYTFSTDIFSFSAIMYVLITKKLKNFAIEVLKDNFKNQMEKEMKDYNISDEITNLIINCFSVLPENRPTPQKIIEILKNEISKLEK